MTSTDVKFLKVRPARPDQILAPETVPLYFESEKRSSGGQIKTLKFIDDYVLVQFEDNNVSKRVLAESHLDYNVESVTDCLPNTNPIDKTRILINGLSMSMEEEVKRFLVTKVDLSDPLSIKFYGGTILVKYQHEIPDFNMLKESIEKGTSAIVEQVPVTNLVRISNVANTDDEYLGLFYERPKYGGDVEKVTVDSETKTAIVEFRSYKDAQKVMASNPSRIEPYYEELEHLASSQKPNLAFELTKAQNECQRLKTLNVTCQKEYQRIMEEMKTLEENLVDLNTKFEGMEHENEECKKMIDELQRQLNESTGITVNDHETYTTKDVCPEQGYHLVSRSDIKIKEKIGTGYNSAVMMKAEYQGETIAVTQMIPLKGIAQQHSLNQTILQICEILKEFHGPLTVKCHGACIDSEKDVYWLLTEYCPHGTLYDFLRDEKVVLTWEDRKKMALNVCKCVQSMHCRQYPMALGQISSKQLLVDADRTIKLYDLSRTGAPSLPSDYQQFQLIRGDDQIHTLQSDRYRLGIVLAEIATGKVPFEGKFASQFNYAQETITEDILPDDCPSLYKEVTFALMQSDEDSGLNVEDAVSRLTM